jgi:hypothetical protein
MQSPDPSSPGPRLDTTQEPNRNTRLAPPLPQVGRTPREEPRPARARKGEERPRRDRMTQVLAPFSGGCGADRLTRRGLGGLGALALGVLGVAADAEARNKKKKGKKKKKKKPVGLCATGFVACHGECVRELNQCPNGTICPRHQLCRGTCQCADRPCTQDSDCFDPVNPYACRNGCCCFPGPGGTYITGPDGCNNQFCCSLKTGPENPPGSGFAQCVPEE